MLATPLTANLPAALEAAGFLPEVVTISEPAEVESEYGYGAAEPTLTAIAGLTAIAAAVGHPTSAIDAERAGEDGTPETDRRVVLIAYADGIHTGCVLTWNGDQYGVVDVRSDPRRGLTELRVERVIP